jgi:hypothetical protein
MTAKRVLLLSPNLGKVKQRYFRSRTGDQQERHSIASVKVRLAARSKHFMAHGLAPGNDLRRNDFLSKQ